MFLSAHEIKHIEQAKKLVFQDPDLLYVETSKSTLKSLIKLVEHLKHGVNISCKGCAFEGDKKEERCLNCIRGLNQPDLYLRK